MQSSYK